MTLTVKRKIVINGKEYHSVDELPPDVRALYDKAMASPNKHVTVKRVTVNGVDYKESSKITLVIVALAILAGILFVVLRAS